MSRKIKMEVRTLPENKVCDMCGYNKVQIEPITSKYSPYKFKAMCDNCGSAINGTTSENTYELYVENCTKEKVNGE